MIIHELDRLPEGAERMDNYLKRRRPDLDIDWYAEGNSGNLQIRDYFDPAAGMYTRQRWYVQHWDGTDWVRLCDLEPGRRPRMFETYCYVLTEEARE